jgi:hypothetical protein
MPKNQQSESLSLPQLLQLAGIGGQPQQDSTREALSYMMGQQRLAADDADRKVKMQQAEQENAYRMKALDAQVNQKDQGSRMHGLISLVSAARTPEELKFAQDALRSELGLSAGVQEKTPEKLAADANTKALADKAKREGTPGKDITMVAEDYGNKAQNALTDAVNMIMGQPIGKSIPTPFQDATAQFISDAQYNTNKHFENQRRIREGRPTIEQEVLNYVNSQPQQPQNVSEYPPLTPAQLPPKTLAPDLYEGQYLANQAQLVTAEHIKRQAALRQMAGLQPKY